LSDSDSGKPKDIWPAIERRKISDRRVERPVRRARVLKEDLEVRTPGPIRREERRSGRDRRDDGAWKAVPLELTLAPEPPEANDEETLVSAAIDARSRAQARYSGFKVGAALETSDGSIVTGCNVENATYALTVCAERVALLKALSEGSTMFTRIVVVADTNDPTPPCGPCRQLLWEYCGDIEVVLANLERATARLKLSALLPMPFDGRLLE
jgi:cytidine deaminase